MEGKRCCVVFCGNEEEVLQRLANLKKTSRTKIAYRIMAYSIKRPQVIKRIFRLTDEEIKELYADINLRNF